MPRRVFISVAEVSGDKHAAQLVRSLKKIEPDIIVEGIGGPEMAAAGVHIHRNTVIKAAMGWRGLLRAFEVIKLLRWTRHYFQTFRPDLHIGVDSPSMNFHFAKVAHEMNIPVLQFVAPQLWAWAIWRMKKLRRWVDRVACILPFEEAWFCKHGVNATFVGHPLFDQLPADRGGDRTGRFPARPPIIGLLPGSRKSEAGDNFPGLVEAAQLIYRDFPDATFVVPTTAATHPVVASLLENKAPSFGNIEVGLNQFDVMVPRCDLCLTVSGTATLHVAGFGVPMIVVYRTGRFVWNLAGRFLVPIRTFALVNLLAEDPTAPKANGQSSEHLVPEYVPWFGEGESIAAHALDLLHHPEKLEAQRAKLKQLVQTLDHPGASDATARMALEMMKK
jgi:lipid-A-disaccharide synthase